MIRQTGDGTRLAASAAFMMLSAGYAIVVATGILTISLSVTAWASGTSFVEYYQYVFPRLRGTAPATRIPAFGYVVFVMYIGVAASVAIHARKRIEAWARRRHAR